MSKYFGKFLGKEIDELLSKVKDGSSVTDNTVDEILINEFRPVSSNAVYNALESTLQKIKEVEETATNVRDDFDILVNGDSSSLIESFNEVVDFLEGLEDTQNLASIIANIERQIADKLSLSGGIINGDLIINSNSNASNALAFRYGNKDFLYLYRDTNDLHILINGQRYKILNSNNIGSYALPLSGGVISGYIAWQNNVNGGDVADWDAEKSNFGIRILSDGGSATGTPIRYSTALQVKGRYGFQLASSGGYDKFYIKNLVNANWDWKEIIHSGNIGEQLVKGFSLSVSSDENVLGSNSEFVVYCLTTSTAGGQDGFLFDMNWKTGLFKTQLYYDIDNTYIAAMRHRQSDGTYTAWKRFAFTDSNVASATKLKDNTAFTAWGQIYFNDGKPVNVSGQLKGVDAIRYSSDNPYGIYFKGSKYTSSLSDTDLAIYATKTILGEGGNVLIGTTKNSGYKLDVNGTLNAGTTTVSGLTVNGITYLGTTSACDVYLQRTDFYSYIRAGHSIRFTVTSSNTTALEIYNSANARFCGSLQIDNNLTAGTTIIDSLTASGDIRVVYKDSVSTNSASAIIRFNGNRNITDEPVQGPSIRALSSGNYGRHRLAIYQHDANDYLTESEVVSVMPNGNVLIGMTEDNGYKLDINGGSLRLCAAIKSINDTIAGFYTYPINPYGLQIRADTSTGNTYLQARREGKSEFFNLILQPDGGYVGIRTNNPKYELDVNGTFNATTIYQNGTALNDLIGTSSDRRLKSNIKQMTDDNAISVLTKLNPVTFIWNDIANNLLDKMSGESSGFIADEYESIIPNSSYSMWDGKYKGIDHNRATSYLVKGWQNHDERLNKVESKANEIDELKSELKQAKEIITQLKLMLNI